MSVENINAQLDGITKLNTVLQTAVSSTSTASRPLWVSAGVSSAVNIAYSAMERLAVIMGGRKSDASAPTNVPRFHANHISTKTPIKKRTFARLSSTVEKTEKLSSVTPKEAISLSEVFSPLMRGRFMQQILIIICRSASSVVAIRIAAMLAPCAYIPAASICPEPIKTNSTIAQVCQTVNPACRAISA